ncbi:Glutamine synthetase, catalytic domain [Carpediemonas membranifera]|uniref:Glutamine synthetase, catalytic domain n=1 Tax=Carpediemonas membranifera TaxID=201153 RepID=A0A8J6DXP8_9EUKA|nr:Glutamine synthetase, catalytic domain [Carpediemonas membranifera]|eukprot:KAG9390744.1 Glutamine synthetase, catalytic domain [Carpediemonas membranifera]
MSQLSPEVQKKLENVPYVQFLCSNILGKLHSMEEHVREVPGNFKNGLGVDGSSIPGYATVTNSDVHLMADQSTLQTINIDGEGPMTKVFCDVHNTDGTRASGCVRSILREQIEKAHKMGFEPFFMSELEWFYLKNGEPLDDGHYLSVAPDDKAGPLRRQVCRHLDEAGMKVRRAHHECAAGQNEIELNLTPALKNADDTCTAMWLIRLLADQQGIEANFMPKPLGSDKAGNGLHQHQRLHDLKTGENLFANFDHPKELSPLGKKYVAGLVKYAREITAVFGMDEQTFDRLKPGHEAPVWSMWAGSNRNALVRVPAISKPESARCEFRAGDASGSPHLLAAVMLAAGLKGIEDDIAVPPECNVDPETELTPEQRKEMGIELLPTSLAECARILDASEFLHEVLGEGLCNYLIHSKEPGFNPYAH